MIRRTPNRPTAVRRAFTLIELMTTVAILLIIMSILAAASSIAAETFRGAKVQGDFVAQERAALAVLRRDLQYPHFLEEDGKPNQGRRLSDQRLDQLVATNPLTGYKPPRSGYFYAESHLTPATNPTEWRADTSGTWNWDEGTDSDGFRSTRSGNHVLQFTIITPGGAPEDTITADVPHGTATPVVGRAAEVAYFLVQDGQTSNTLTSPGKYKLIRRQRLAAFNDDDKPAYSLTGVPVADSSEVMAVNTAGTSIFNLHDLTLAASRLFGTTGVRSAIPSTGYRYGEDVLLTNVTSFEVKFTGPRATGVVWSDTSSTEWPRPFQHPTVPGLLLNSDHPYDNLPFDGKYDTFHQNTDWDKWDTAATPPGPINLATTTKTTGALKKIRITGVMIRLRCWNPNAKSSRQTTITVDL